MQCLTTRRTIAVIVLLGTLVTPTALIAESTLAPPASDEAASLVADLWEAFVGVWEDLLGVPEPQTDPISSQADEPGLDPDAGPVIDPAG
jgi:hypothetical protein